MGNNGQIVVVGLFEVVGVAVSVWLFGLPIWIPVQVALVFAALITRRTGPGGILIAANAVIGLDLCGPLFGVEWIIWPALLIGIAAIALLVYTAASAGVAAPAPDGET